MLLLKTKCYQLVQETKDYQTRLLYSYSIPVHVKMNNQRDASAWRYGADNTYNLFYSWEGLAVALYLWNTYAANNYGGIL